MSVVIEGLTPRRPSRPSPAQVHVGTQLYPLHEAARLGSVDEMKRLLSYNISELNEIDNFGQTALHIAAFENQTESLNFLLSKGGSLISKDKNGWTPLHCAGARGNLEICEKLIVEGAPVDAQNNSGSTPLHYLMCLPCSDMLMFVLHLMVKRKCNVNIKNEHGQTPLHNAALRAGEGNVLFLLQNGSKVNETNNYQETALHMAARAGKKRIVQLLINFNADIDLKGPYGSSYDEALANNHHDIVEFLEGLKPLAASMASRRMATRSSIKKPFSARVELRKLFEMMPSNDDTSSSESVDWSVSANTGGVSSSPNVGRYTGSPTTSESGTVREHNVPPVSNAKSASELASRVKPRLINSVSHSDATNDDIMRHSAPSNVIIPTRPSLLRRRSPQRNLTDLVDPDTNIRGVDSINVFGFKSQIISSEYVPQARLRYRRPDAEKYQPFQQDFGKIDILDMLTIFEIPAPPQERPGQDEITVATSLFYAELGHNPQPEHLPILFIEDTESTSFHYKDNFFKEKDPLDQINIIGTLELDFYPGEPILISLIEKDDTTLFGIARMRQGDFTFNIKVDELQMVKIIANPKKVIKILQAQNKYFATSKLQVVKDKKIAKDLLDYERSQKNQFKKIICHKIGMVYMKGEQTSEDDILGNPIGSPKFEEFLQFLGEKVELKGFQHYAGELDTMNDYNGTHSIYTHWVDFEIMFHVSTYMPLALVEDEPSQQILSRKRFIGNDLTCVVFLEGDGVFVPPTISGDFLHVFIVVQPVGDDRYRVALAVREGVPQFGPALPDPPIFKKDETFKDFLLSKMVNAERAALTAPFIRGKRRFTRLKTLQLILEEHYRESAAKKSDSFDRPK
jgi:ankyrin repeat protein